MNSGSWLVVVYIVLFGIVALLTAPLWLFLGAIAVALFSN